MNAAAKSAPITDTELTILRAAANLCDEITTRLFVAATKSRDKDDTRPDPYDVLNVAAVRGRFQVAHETLTMALASYERRIVAETQAAS